MTTQKTFKKNLDEIFKEKKHDPDQMTAAEMLMKMGGNKNRDRIKALLYVLDLLLERESPKYKEMAVSLFYEYVPVKRNFTNMIICHCNINGEPKAEQICFDDDADFMDVIAETVTKLSRLYNTNAKAKNK